MMAFLSLRSPKRLTVFACAIALLLMLFSACDTGSSGADTETEDAIATEAETTVTGGATEGTTEAPAPSITYSATIQYLLDHELISASEVRSYEDTLASFRLVTVSVADLLKRGSIDTLPDDEGQSVSVEVYRDWYLYTAEDYCSLFYMKTGQESTGVGVSFVILDAESLKACLSGADGALAALNRALADVTNPQSEQKHSPVLTGYFKQAMASGAYGIAEAYVEKIAAAGDNGVIPVPHHYTTCPATDAEYIRVIQALRYLDERHPGLMVWEEDRPVGVRVADAQNLHPYEKQAILALYTMDVTFCSFAAEIAAHALGCDTQIITEVYGYERCKIADMAPGRYNEAAGTVARWNNDFGFYNLNSTAVKSQEQYHNEYVGEYVS